MGNRAVIIVTNGQGWWSPSIYLHWHGTEVRQILQEAVKRMRLGDVSYTAARIVGTAHEIIKGNLSLGISSNHWQEKAMAEDNKPGWRCGCWYPDTEDLAAVNQGDNGVFVFDCRTGRLRQYWVAGRDEDEKPIGFNMASSYIDISEARM